MNKKCWYKDSCNLYNTDECSEYCIRYYKMKKLMDLARIPTGLQKIHKLIPDNIDVDSFMELKKIKENINEFVDGGYNLYIYSKFTGNGKTANAIKLIQSYLNNIWLETELVTQALFINLPEYITMTSSKVGNNLDYDELKPLIYNTRLIVWDSMPIAKPTDYQAIQLLTQVEYRINNSYANVFTGTLNKREMDDKLGKELSSRIYNSSKVIEIKSSEDRRCGFDF